MKLKGIELKGTYKVEFDDIWFEVYDDKDQAIYFENNDGYWSKSEYDERDNLIYFEDSNGYWLKKEYDENGDETYYEDSDGYIIDNRVKEQNKTKGDRKWVKNN